MTSPEAAARPEPGRLVVILSPENSGSTMLAAALGGHPRVVAPPELHLFRHPDFDVWAQGLPKARASLTWLLDVLGEASAGDDLEARYGGWSVADVYRDLLARCGASRVLVDKTPAYAREVAVLERIEEFRPFYVWLVRHPLGVLSSNSSRRAIRNQERRERHPYLPYHLWLDLEKFYDRFTFEDRRLHYWLDVNRRIESFLEGVPAERSARVVFEQLVRDPQEELGRLCAALGLEFDAAMLEPGRHVPKTLTWGIGSEKATQHVKMDPRVADRWRERLDESRLTPGFRAAMDRFGIC